MQIHNNCYRYVWLLSGTGEGPHIAQALLEKGWRVFVSVVTPQAALSYSGMALEAIWIGALEGEDQIKQILDKLKNESKKISCIVDATHPFATLISSQLIQACKFSDYVLIRFDRPIYNSPSSVFLTDSNQLKDFPLKGKRLLLAIGSRYLSKYVFNARKSGARVFARVLPNPRSIIGALNCSIPEEDIAVLKPFDSSSEGETELALCRRWSINSILCRQSGGLTQFSWQRICQENNLKLFLIARPKIQNSFDTVFSVKDLLDKLNKIR